MVESILLRNSLLQEDAEPLQRKVNLWKHFKSDDAIAETKNVENNIVLVISRLA